MAVIPEAKLPDYLLSPTHPHGRHKAFFFGRLGFSQERWQELASALHAHTERHEVGLRNRPSECDMPWTAI